MYHDSDRELRFLTDRMLGSLCRYLRFMGYDTVSANSIPPGSNREDTELLAITSREQRILLTRDQELARRAGPAGVLIRSEDLDDQLRQLAGLRLISPVLKLTRCSCCNTVLIPATERDVEAADYAPAARAGIEFFICPACHRLYWYGSHARRMQERVGRFSDLAYEG